MAWDNTKRKVQPIGAGQAGAIPGPVIPGGGDNTRIPTQTGEYITPIDAMIAKGRELMPKQKLSDQQAYAIGKQWYDQETERLKNAGGNPEPVRNALPPPIGYQEGGMMLNAGKWLDKNIAQPLGNLVSGGASPSPRTPAPPAPQPAAASPANVGSGYIKQGANAISRHMQDLKDAGGYAQGGASGWPVFGQKSIENWQPPFDTTNAPYETDVTKLAKAHPIANVIGFGLPAAGQAIAGGIGNLAKKVTGTVGNVVSAMATPSDTSLLTGIQNAYANPSSANPQGASGEWTAAQGSPNNGQPKVQPIGAFAADNTTYPNLSDNSGANAPVQPKVAPIGAMSVQGGGTATIDAHGNINRDAAFNAANRADAIKNHGGIGGTVNVMAPGSTTPFDKAVQPIGGGGDKWSFLEDGSAFGAAKAGIGRKLGYVPIDYDRNPGKYDAVIAGQGAQYAQAENAVPVAQINAAANNITAPSVAAHNQAIADSLKTEMPLLPDVQKSIIGKNVDEGVAKLTAASKTKGFDRAKALEENLRIAKGDPAAAATLTQQQEYLSNGVGQIIPPQKTIINSENGEAQPYVVSGVIHKDNYPQYKSLMDQWANEIKSYNSNRPSSFLGIGGGGRNDAYNAHVKRRENILNSLRSLGVTVDPEGQKQT